MTSCTRAFGSMSRCGCGPSGRQLVTEVALDYAHHRLRPPPLRVAARAARPSRPQPPPHPVAPQARRRRLLKSAKRSSLCVKNFCLIYDWRALYSPLLYCSRHRWRVKPASLSSDRLKCRSAEGAIEAALLRRLDPFRQGYHVSSLFAFGVPPWRAHARVRDGEPGGGVSSIP
jgi:hypothetical protein